MPILTLIIALLVAIIVAVSALVIQSRRFEKIAAQQEAWERAQQSHLRTLEIQQERRITILEARFTAEFKEIQEARQKWETTDVARLETLAKDYQAAATQLRLEHELARIPRIEDIPLSTDAHGQTQPAIANWRPLMLSQADLHKLDLSHRYLGHADLREAQLVGATLFMTNLSGANLSGADLSNADLSGTDLSGADLHDATLTGANLMVADLHNAVLTGANLLGVRNLTMQQLHSATYDSTTLLDAEIDDTPTRVQKTHRGNDITSVHLEAVRPVIPSLPVTPVPVTAEASTLATEQETSIPAEADTQSEELSSPIMAYTTSFIQHLAEPSAASRTEAVVPTPQDEPASLAAPMIDASVPAAPTNTEPTAPSDTSDRQSELSSET
ncbi:MAG TPA: pentapeptide repeat-containing protein, partial [Ktedonobacteraceae bacterium]|nr:pentapeptide repeat-containing protein [Ktedonobacteraceae bacterium]